MPALILLSYVSLLALSLLDNVRGPFYPDILSDLAVSATKGSFFFATVSFFAIAGNWASHFLLARTTSVRLLAWASLVLAVGFSLISVAPGLELMLIACAIFGSAFGILNVVQNVLIYEAASGESRRRIFNGLHAMYALASLAAPLMASFLRDHGWTWRNSFFFSALFPAAVGLWAIFFRSRGTHAAEEKPAPRAKMDARDWRDTCFYAAAMALYLWGELSISTRLPLWLRTERAMPADHADLYLAGFFFMLLSGRTLFSFLSLRHISNWTVLTVSSGLSAAVYFAGLNWEPRLLMLLGLTLAPFYPVLMEQAGCRFTTRSSQALGAIIAGGSISLVFMHVVIGMITDASGLTSALSLCACLLTILTLGLLGRALVPKTGRELTA